MLIVFILVVRAPLICEAVFGKFDAPASLCENFSDTI